MEVILDLNNVIISIVTGLTTLRMLNGNCKRFVTEVSLEEVNKPTTRNTRDAKDFVLPKRLARKKRLLPGYYYEGVLSWDTSELNSS